MLQEIISPFETDLSQVLKSICEYLLEDNDDSVNATSSAATHVDMYSRSLSSRSLLLTESWSQLPLEVDDSEDILAYGALRDVLNSECMMPLASNRELDLEVTAIDYNSISLATEKKLEMVEREASRGIPSSLTGEELLRRSHSNKHRCAKFCRSLAALFAGHLISWSADVRESSAVVPEIHRFIKMSYGWMPDASDIWILCVTLTVVLICFIVSLVFAIFLCVLIGPDYPILKVVGLTMSNLTVIALTEATWITTLLVEKPDIHGNLFFREVDSLPLVPLRHTRPLALALAEPFVLRAADRNVIKAKVMMERLEEAVVEDMDREWRLGGTVAIKLGLTMRGTYVLGSWWKKGYGCIETLLSLRVANSMGEEA
ncbi:hypothetical protein NL676_039587 [Syzygium grande]|nr:hypothetical protein NL676_039587 [Syzygium grande]